MTHPELERSLERAIALMRTLGKGSPTIPEARERYEALCRHFPPVGDARVEDQCGPVPGSLRVSTPESRLDRVLLMVHGGGGVFGRARGYTGWAARLASVTQSVVVVVDYRLAPEHPFPAALDDVTHEWLALREAGFRPDQIAIYGDSAGGGIALALAIRTRDLYGERAAGVVTVSALTDRVGFGPTFTSNEHLDPVISRRGTTENRALYIGNADPADPLASPLFARLEGLPPVLLQAGSTEVLLSDSTRFAGRATAVGVEADVIVYEGMFHAFPLIDFLPASARAIDDAARFLRACWDARQGRGTG